MAFGERFPLVPSTRFEAFGFELRRFIERTAGGAFSANGESGARLDDEFEGFARRLFALQYTQVPALRRLCDARNLTPENLPNWHSIPAMPSRAFKEFPVTSLPPADRRTVFQSSGTTMENASRHYHDAASLALYAASLQPWFRWHLLADRMSEARARPLPFLALTPSPVQAPNSSLVHMFGAVMREWGDAASLFVGEVATDGGWRLDADTALGALERLADAAAPVCVLGTAFSFVHLLDHLQAQSLRFVLPAGSRVLETGGYKGRSRSVPQAELHQMLTDRLGVPSAQIVCEYGMSELSSQAYDRRIGEFESPGAGSGVERVFHFPPWARAVVVSSEDGRPVAPGETGLLRVFDLANLRSVLAVQTEDLARGRGDGFELLGRAPRAEPRGCSLAATTAAGAHP